MEKKLRNQREIHLVFKYNKKRVFYDFKLIKSDNEEKFDFDLATKSICTALHHREELAAYRILLGNVIELTKKRNKKYFKKLNLLQYATEYNKRFNQKSTKRNKQTIH